MILVAIPYHEHKRYCLDHLFDWINSADLQGCEIVMRFHKGTFGEKNAVKTQREFFRQEAIRLNATHLMFVGADTVPPLDVVPRLLARAQDVVGGVYYGRHGATNGLPHTAVAWRHGTEFNKKENLDTLVELQVVDGMGMDCVMFSRKAFEAVGFLEWTQNDDDYPYYDKLKEKGFKVFLDPTIICKHYADKEHYS